MTLFVTHRAIIITDGSKLFEANNNDDKQGDLVSALWCRYTSRTITKTSRNLVKIQIFCSNLQCLNIFQTVRLSADNLLSHIVCFSTSYINFLILSSFSSLRTFLLRSQYFRVSPCSRGRRRTMIAL